MIGHPFRNFWWLARKPRRSRRPLLEPLESRELLAFDLTISKNPTESIVSSTLAGITTFAAKASKANLSLADINTELAAGHSVIVDSGSQGAEPGNISTSGFTTQEFGNVAGTFLEIRTGAGSGLIGDISLAGLKLAATGTLIVQAARNATFSDIVFGSSMSVTAQGGSIHTTGKGLLQATTLTLSAKTDLGASSLAPLVVSSDQLTTDTSVGDGDQFITEVNGLTALDLDAGSGSIALVLAGGAVSDTDSAIDIAAGTATVALLASTAQSFGGSANRIGTNVNSLAVNTATGSGNQFITEANGLSAVGLNAGGGNVTLIVTAGDVFDSDGTDDITATAATVTLNDISFANFGSNSHPIGTNVDDLKVVTGKGSQFISEANGLTALDLQANVGGNITLTVVHGSVTDNDTATDITAPVSAVKIALLDTAPVTFGGNASISTSVNDLSVDTSAGNGFQSVTELNGLAALSLNAGTGSAVLQLTAGAIFDNDSFTDITASVASIALFDTTARDVGTSPNPIGTNVNTIFMDTKHGGGDLFVTEADGLTTLAINAGSGDLTLTLTAGALTDPNGSADILAARATITLLDTTAKDFGSAAQPIGTQVDSLTVNTAAGGGSQFISEADGLTALNLDAASGNVTLNITGGAVSDTDSDTDVNCTTAIFTLLAATAQNFGASANRLQTNVRNLAVSTSAGGGGQFITEANGLSNVDLNAGTGDVTVVLTLGEINDTDTSTDITAHAAIIALNDGGFAGVTIDTSVDELSVSTAKGRQTITEADGLTALDLDVRTAAPIALTLLHGSVTDDDTLEDIHNPVNTVTITLADSTAQTLGTSDHPIRIDVFNLTIDTAAGSGNQFLFEPNSTNITSLDAGSGSVTLAGGTFNLATGNAIGDDSTLNVDSPATVNLASSNEAIGALAGSGTVAFKADGVDQTLTVGGNGASTVFSGGIAGNDLTGEQVHDVFRKIGAGTLALSGANPFTGTYFASEGALLVNGSLTLSFQGLFVGAGATLGGTGTINRFVSVDGGAHLAPGISPGTLSVQNLNLFDGAAFDVEINSAAAGHFDQAHATFVFLGTTSGGATLNLSSSGTVSLHNGDRLPIIQNDGGVSVQGTFKNLPEGANLGSNFLGSGLTAQITYVGGDGNDVEVVLSPGSLFPWHNPTRGLDVINDGHVVAADALAIINYINAFGSAVPSGAVIGQPFGFLDTSADNVIAPNDVIQVINFINAFGSGFPGPAGEGDSTASSCTGQQPLDLVAGPLEDLILLLAFDAAAQTSRARRGS